MGELKVLIPKLPGTHNGYIEAFRNNSTVVLQYEPHKGNEALASKLASFEGVLVADAEHRHSAVLESGRVLEAGCNAHSRRKLRNAEKAQPILAVEGGDFIAAIYRTEAEAKKAGLQGEKLSLASRKGDTPEEQAPWLDGCRTHTRRRSRENHPILSKPLDALFRFVDHPEIPIDNSGTEREFQNFAKLRHNRLFAGSSEGAHRMATLFGIVTTCRALEVAPPGLPGLGLHAPRHPSRCLRTRCFSAQASRLQGRPLHHLRPEPPRQQIRSDDSQTERRLPALDPRVRRSRPAESLESLPRHAHASALQVYYGPASIVGHPVADRSRSGGRPVSGVWQGSEAGPYGRNLDSPTPVGAWDLSLVRNGRDASLLLS